MSKRFILVLDSDEQADPLNWRASQVASTREGIVCQHDGRANLIPRRSGDRRVGSCTSTHRDTGTREPAGVYEIDA